MTQKRIFPGLACCAALAFILFNTAPAKAFSAGSMTLQASTYTLDQSGGTISFAVTRADGSDGAISVDYATSDGTAIAGTDYVAKSGTLSWADGDSTTVNTITVSWNDVIVYSGGKTFTVTLSSPTNGAELGDYPSTLVTVNNDLIAPSTLSFFQNSFSTSSWKLTLPIDIYGGMGGTNGTQYAAASVKASLLTAGFANPDFYADSAGHVIFTDYSNGATTTPGSGSDHTRSEMRELYTGSGTVGNSSWDSTLGGSMHGDMSVEAVSVDSDEATFAQIHGDTAVFTLLVYRPAKNDIAVAMYPTPTSTKGSFTEVLSGISLGDRICYTLSYTGNTVTVTVRSGNNSNTMDFDVTAWAGTPVHFSYGAYAAAPKTGNPSGDQTRVSYSSLTVTHPY